MPSKLEDVDLIGVKKIDNETCLPTYSRSFIIVCIS